jgi:predicted ATPase/class 3 adenylate cyclase
MERKLATALFVDLVDSTRLLSDSDPEVARHRVTGFFAEAARHVEDFGGTLEKFAGDAVVAVFGVPVAHEDDAERAVRAALAVVDGIKPSGLEVRIGIESGEMVAEDVESTFATGRALNLAARLQQCAEPGEILIGPTAHGLVADRIVSEPLGERALKGFAGEIPVWKVVCADGVATRRPMIGSSFVGRVEELELLENVYARVVRDRRAHLVTIFGEPGIGKSRLVLEYTEGLERTTVLSGRCPAFGEGLTYWPLAEMIKAGAGISDDDDRADAAEKLRDACGADAVADLLGLASGVLDFVVGMQSASESAWAAHEWATLFAEAQPLVLVFEDIHWAEEALLDLIEHLAARIVDAPVLIVCVTRPDLLETRPAWGGGRLRGVSIELGPLRADESHALLDGLRSGLRLDDETLANVLAKTEGNPLYVEETVRMLAERGADAPFTGEIPDTLQALIAARIDGLPANCKTVIRCGAVLGRVFWDGAVSSLCGFDVVEPLERLAAREIVTRETRTTVPGQTAYRFRHGLIRDVAYSGLWKGDRARLHQAFAEWLEEHYGEEHVEMRAYHLEQAVTLHEELDGDVSGELASSAAAALEAAGMRALGREAYRAARRMLLRAATLEPTLERRYEAARAAWRLTDIPAVSSEMEAVRLAAIEAGDRSIEGRALTGLAKVALYRDGDAELARRLSSEALAAASSDDSVARFEALELLGTVAWWEGDLATVQHLAQDELAIAQHLGRADLESGVLLELSDLHHARLEREPAAAYLARARSLAEQSGRPTSLAYVLRLEGRHAVTDGRLDDACTLLEQARDLFQESGMTMPLARTLNWLAIVAWRRGELKDAERLLRDAVRLLAPLEDRGTLVESQRMLAQVLLEQGRVPEAEQAAFQASETVAGPDVASSSSTRLALGLVRAAQQRDEEAEQLLREAVEIIASSDYRSHDAEPFNALASFLRERGREADADSVDDALYALRQASGASRIG